MQLQLIDQQKYMILKFPVKSTLPSTFHKITSFKSVTYTEEECSIIVPEDSISIDDAIDVDKDWVIIKIVGILDFSLVGILAKLANPLADNNISIFALSTFNTDYLLIKHKDSEKARTILQKQGHEFL